MLLQIEYYTNVLTIIHISNSTGVPSTDIGVERVRTENTDRSSGSSSSCVCVRSVSV